MISNINPVLEYFGLDIEMIEFRGNFARIARADTTSGNVKTVDLPSGFNTFKSHLMKIFPEDSESIKRLLEYSREMFEEILGLKYNPGMIEMLQILFTCPKIIRNASKNFSAFLKGFHFKNPDVYEVFHLFSVLCGIPESRAAALLPVGVMHSLLEKAYRPAEGFIEIPRKMEQKFLELGGELRLKTEVKKILIENGRVKGVRLESGEEIFSENVITTIDVKASMNDLAGLDNIGKKNSAYRKKVDGLTMTPSVFTVNLGLDDGINLKEFGLDCGITMLTTGSRSYEMLYDAFLEGRNAFSEKDFHIDIICPSLAAGGRPVLTVTAQPFPMGEWNNLRKNDRGLYKLEKEKWADFLIGLAEKYLIPGLRKHISVMDISSPATYSRYSGSPSGSQYDMASYVDNFGLKRLSTITPVKGLYQPKFAQGVFGTIHGGLHAVDQIMGRRILNGNSRLPA
jgi:phytoene dehydrogenase-like protein